MNTAVMSQLRRLTDVVNPEVVQYFEEIGLFEPAVNNKRKISPSTMSPSVSPSSTTSQHSTPSHLVDGAGQFQAATVAEITDYVDIPTKLESSETLELMGFCPDRAETILNLWLTIPSDAEGPRTFLDFTLEFVKDPDNFKDAFSETDDWERSLNQLGISAKLKNAILMPEFRDVRYTASCRFWVAEAIEDNYYALESLGQELKETADYLKSINFKGGEKKRFRRAGSVSKPPSLPSPASRKQRSGRERPHNETQNHIGTKTTLYRASSLKRALRYYNSVTGEASDILFGSFPGDLSGRAVLTYWTPKGSR
ncbi:hypothetical protein TWF281_011044 [Arthrobotrys megalospora]